MLFMILYTVKCFSALSVTDEKKRKKKTNKQIGYVFLIHFFCYLVLYLRNEDLSIIIFYFAQIIVAVLYMLIFHGIYRESSALLTNNTAFLLLIGYTMLTRLDMELAIKQFVLATTGLVITSFFPYIMTRTKNLRDHAVFFGVTGLIALLSVFIPGFGQEIYGSRNWVHIGPLSLQPMEFVKILFVLFVAGTLVKANTIKDLFVNAVISAMFMGILVVEKDLGAAVIFYITYVCMVYLATSRPIFLVGGLGLGVAAVVCGYLLFKDSLFAHVMVRVSAWQDPFANIDGAGYQVAQSLFAIGTGGYIGTGLCRGLPEVIPVAESDFIFSAICEELGVIFGLALILVIVSIFISFVNVSMKCRDPFYKYVSFGFSVIYIVQSLLNLGGVTKFIPSTGVTLPLVSYGVSSILSTLVIFTVIQGIYVVTTREAIKNEKDRERARNFLEQAHSAVSSEQR